MESSRNFGIRGEKSVTPARTMSRRASLERTLGDERLTLLNLSLVDVKLEFLARTLTITL